MMIQKRYCYAALLVVTSVCSGMERGLSNSDGRDLIQLAVKTYFLMKKMNDLYNGDQDSSGGNYFHPHQHELIASWQLTNKDEHKQSVERPALTGEYCKQNKIALRARL